MPAQTKAAPAPVITIDCDYLAPRYAAAYLLVEGDRAAFVENNTAHAVPRLLEALKQARRTPEQVELIIITHVHLDHAGGTSALLEHCPNAKVIAHPRAARHVIDPSRLVESARKVYGADRFRELYGEIHPIDPGRVQSPEDGEVMKWGSRRLKFIYTRGHANHHFCIHDSGSNGIFTGDSFGLAYPALQGREPFIIPSTSPTDFDGPEARASIQKICASGAERAYLTHFGEVALNDAACSELLTHLDFSEGLFREGVSSALGQSALEARFRTELARHYERTLEAKGVTFTAERRQLLALDTELNAAGLAYAAIKQRTSG